MVATSHVCRKKWHLLMACLTFLVAHVLSSPPTPPTPPQKSFRVTLIRTMGPPHQTLNRGVTWWVKNHNSPKRCQTLNSEPSTDSFLACYCCLCSRTTRTWRNWKEDIGLNNWEHLASPWSAHNAYIKTQCIMRLFAQLRLVESRRS